MLGDRDDRQRVGQPVRDQVRPLQRIDGDVHLWRVGGAVADGFADVEHGRLVALALADDDGAAHVNEPEGVAHRFSGGAVGAVPIAAPDETSRRQRGRLGHPNHLESQVPIHGSIVLPTGAAG